ncbi:hypothetical protein [Bacillus sp. S10(2024)]|uniref:hypothetical protein n=1 Tax=Bacillus sp. S10(2024) TaxID=3162886 RepID=UPI003D2102F4
MDGPATLLVHASKNDTDQLQKKLMECGFKHIYSATLAEEISFKKEVVEYNAQ